VSSDADKKMNACSSNFIFLTNKGEVPLVPHFWDFAMLSLNLLQVNHWLGTLTVGRFIFGIWSKQNLYRLLLVAMKRRRSMLVCRWKNELRRLDGPLLRVLRDILTV